MLELCSGQQTNEDDLTNPNTPVLEEYVDHCYIQLSDLLNVKNREKFKPRVFSQDTPKYKKYIKEITPKLKDECMKNLKPAQRCELPRTDKDWEKSVEQLFSQTSSYCPASNAIVIHPEQPLAVSVAEEMGHAFRYNLSKEEKDMAVFRVNGKRIEISVQEFFGFLARGLMLDLDKGTSYEKLHEKDDLHSLEDEIDVLAKRANDFSFELLLNEVIDLQNSYFKFRAKMKEKKLTDRNIERFKDYDKKFERMNKRVLKIYEKGYNDVCDFKIQCGVCDISGFLNRCQEDIVYITRFRSLDTATDLKRDYNVFIKPQLNKAGALKNNVVEGVKYFFENDVDHLPYEAAKDCINQYGSAIRFLESAPNLFSMPTKEVFEKYIKPSMEKRAQPRKSMHKEN